MNLQIVKVENGYILEVGGSIDFGSRSLRYVFSEWSELCAFFSTLNERFSK